MNQTTMSTMDDGLQRMIRAHIWYGAAGVILGLIAAAVAVAIGPDLLSSSPLFTYVAFGLIGGIGLSMAGGLWTFYR
ncbi:MAG: hypothetical protein AAGH19_08255 [Pseudomonadota bacterium]